MKRIFIICASFLICSVTNAFSVPMLQLDSTIINDTTIELKALIKPKILKKMKRNKYQLNIQTSLLSPTGPVSAGDYGSFDFGDATTNATSNMQQDGTDGTWFKDFILDFQSAEKTKGYNVKKDKKAKGKLYALTYLVDLSNLASGFGLHFDLYGFKMTKKGKIIFKSTRYAHSSYDFFAPTITTAGIQISDPKITAPVPEPATMLLFGAGLAGLACVGRKSKKRNSAI